MQCQNVECENNAAFILPGPPDNDPTDVYLCKECVKLEGRFQVSILYDPPCRSMMSCMNSHIPLGVLHICSEAEYLQCDAIM